MKPKRQFGPLPHVRYRPEVATCLHCGAPLAYSHPVWAKPLQFLTALEHVTNLGFRCVNPDCAFRRTVYRSAQAEARQIKGSDYGLDVVVRIGHQRFSQHRTREEIWGDLRGLVQISERHVQNLIEVYLALLRASQHNPVERLGGVVEEHGGIILSLDGLQPEQGNEQLWIVREVFSGTVLGATNLQQASAAILATLLEPIQKTGLPLLGVISDAPESIRLAVASVFPGVPHQTCQYHALREASEPLAVSDQKKAADSADAVVLDTVLALRQTVRERGVLPFDFAGLRAMDSLDALGATLDGCLAKRGTRGWPDCGF